MTFEGRTVLPVIFERLLFCNSLQYQRATSNRLENPVLDACKLIEVNPRCYTLEFYKRVCCNQKTNQLYLYQYKHKMFESMNVHTHTQQKIMLLTKGNRNIVTQILHCKVSICIQRHTIPNSGWN